MSLFTLVRQSQRLQLPSGYALLYFYGFEGNREFSRVSELFSHSCFTSGFPSSMIVLIKCAEPIPRFHNVERGLILLTEAENELCIDGSLKNVIEKLLSNPVLVTDKIYAYLVSHCNEVYL